MVREEQDQEVRIDQDKDNGRDQVEENRLKKVGEVEEVKLPKENSPKKMVSPRTSKVAMNKELLVGWKGNDTTKSEKYKKNLGESPSKRDPTSPQSYRESTESYLSKFRQD